MEKLKGRIVNIEKHQDRAVYIKQGIQGSEHKKSKAVPPAYADDIIRLSAENAVRRSVKVYNSRGTYSDKKGNASVPQLSYVWEQRKDSRGIYSFCLNKKHTLLNRLKSSLSNEQKNILNAYLSLVEKCSPMEISGVTHTVGNKTNNISESEYEELLYNAKKMIFTLVSNNYSKEEVRSLFQQLPDYSMLMEYFDDLFTEVYNESK